VVLSSSIDNPQVKYYGQTLLAEDNIQWEAYVIAMMTLQDLH
jgi:hypothetical protein